MKTIRIVLSVLLMLCNLTPSYAYEKEIYNKDFSNNITIEYSLESVFSRASSTVEGRKTAKVMNGSTLLWTVTVIGTFTYDGFHSSCTKAEVSTTCPASAWKIASSSATKSGSSATARATGQRYNNGVVVQTLTEAVSLVCGSDGTLY